MVVHCNSKINWTLAIILKYSAKLHIKSFLLSQLYNTCSLKTIINSSLLLFAANQYRALQSFSVQ